jgi:tRNA(adenine34) deaminase
MPNPRLRACALCVVDKNLLMVRLEDPVSKRLYLFPPGGGIEAGESPASAAERETTEETGYRVRVDPASESILHYPFHWGGKIYQCTTHFFLAKLADNRPPSAVTDEEFHRGVVWFPISELRQELAYHPQLAEAVVKILASSFDR